MIHCTPIKVRFYELDPYRHLNHSVYIQYFEVGRIDLFGAFGWSLGHMEDLGTMIVVTDIETRFLVPGVEGDELVVETWVEEIKRVTSLFGQQIVRGDEVLATQKVRGACTTLAGRPTRFPEELRVGMRPYVTEPS
jgi:acyl-CoA thioester hydrolase